MDPSELTDLSLLIFVDLGMKQRRTHLRVNTLISGEAGTLGVPLPLQSLVQAGLVHLRRSGAEGYKIEITDAGMLVHRRMIEALRSSIQQPASSH